MSIGLIVLLAGLMICLEPGRVAADGHLPTLSYRGGSQGKVIFDHQVHASVGFRCVDCHTDFAGTSRILFTTRKQGLISLKDHSTGTRCFACHNGEGVTTDRKGTFIQGKGAFNECKRCHRKN